MNKSTIQQVIDIFYECFEALGAQYSPLELEDMAVVLHRNMTLHTRYYHSIDHVLGFYDPENPIYSLAALFHDIVYYQVDQGFAPEIEQVIGDYIHLREDSIFLREQIPEEDHLARLTLDVFGFAPGDELHTNAGLNEFLSALFMNKKLEGMLKIRQLLWMTACVEATIPFRWENEIGESPFDVLAGRLERIQEQDHLGMESEETQTIVHAAVRFANQDVESFAEDDPGCYLDSTWKLLPETNQALRARNFYTIREYRQALHKMSCFLNDLNPDRIFHQYAGKPTRDAFQIMVRQAHKNVNTGREYLRLKLLAITLLEALAEESGGDAPLSLFMGGIPTGDESLNRMEEYLPEPPHNDLIDHTSVVYSLLESGRGNDTIFDLKTAPLSRFLYNSIPQEHIIRLSNLGTAMFKGQVSAQDFLAAVDPPVVVAVARACAEVARTRRAVLLALADKIDG